MAAAVDQKADRLLIRHSLRLRETAVFSNGLGVPSRQLVPLYTIIGTLSRYTD